MPTNASAQTSVSATQLAKGSIYRLPGNAEIGSVTVDASQFVGNLTVYNGTTPGNPLFQVASGQVKTMPVGASRNLFLQSPLTGTGVIYLQFTDQFLSSTTNLSQIAPVASQTWCLLTEGQVIVNNATHGTIADPYWGTLAWINLNNSFQNVSNGKGTSPFVYLQSLEVSGIPPYVTCGVYMTGSLATVPAGMAALLTGPGKWAPAVPKVYGGLAGIIPAVFAMFGNYDNTQQIFGLQMQYSLAGYST